MEAAAILASTGVSPDRHQVAQVKAMVSSAASERYPNLAAALAG